jgi:ABC-type uncharacterized transport system ATPase subunit
MGQKQQLSWDLAAVDSFLVNRAVYEIPDAVDRNRLGELTEMLSLVGLLHKQVWAAKRGRPSSARSPTWPSTGLRSKFG